MFFAVRSDRGIKSKYSNGCVLCFNSAALAGSTEETLRIFISELLVVAKTVTASAPAVFQGWGRALRLEGLLLLAHYLTSLLQQMCFGVHSVCDPESAQEEGWQGR